MRVGDGSGARDSTETLTQAIASNTAPTPADRHRSELPKGCTFFAEPLRREAHDITRGWDCQSQAIVDFSTALALQTAVVNSAPALFLPSNPIVFHGSTVLASSGARLPVNGHGSV